MRLEVAAMFSQADHPTSASPPPTTPLTESRTIVVTDGVSCDDDDRLRSSIFLHTHTHTTILLLFWSMCGTTRVSRYQKGKTRKVKTNLDLLEQESEWQWHLLSYMQVCASSQTTTPTSHHSCLLYTSDAADE